MSAAATPAPSAVEGPCGYVGCTAPAAQAVNPAGDIKLCTEHAAEWEQRSTAMAAGEGRAAIKAWLAFWVKARGGSAAATRSVLGRR
jgi:hypothetical protein